MYHFDYILNIEMSMLSHREDVILIYLHVASSIKKLEPVPFPVGES